MILTIQMLYGLWLIVPGLIWIVLRRMRSYMERKNRLWSRRLLRMVWRRVPKRQSLYLKYQEVAFDSPVQDDAIETYDPAYDTSTDADDIFVNEGVIVEPAEVAAASARNAFDKYDCPEEGCEKVGENGFARHGNVTVHVNKVHAVNEEIVPEAFPGMASME